MSWFLNSQLITIAAGSISLVFFRGWRGMRTIAAVRGGGLFLVPSSSASPLLMFWFTGCSSLTRRPIRPSCRVPSTRKVEFWPWSVAWYWSGNVASTEIGRWLANYIVALEWLSHRNQPPR